MTLAPSQSPLYQLLSSPSFRTEPSSILSPPSVEGLQAFIQGYKACEADHELPKLEMPPFWLFPYWVHLQLAGSLPTEAPLWVDFIQQAAKGDAFELFFQLFDAFLEVHPTLIETALISYDEIAFWQAQSHTPVDMPEQLYLVHFSHELGSAIEGLPDHNGVRIFTNEIIAKEASRQKLGPNIDWEPVIGQNAMIALRNMG